MIEYLVKSTVCFLILYLGYIGFFRNSRNYHVNRMVLLFSVLFSLMVPTLNMEPTVVPHVAEVYQVPLEKVLSGTEYLQIKQPIPAEQQSNSITFYEWILAIYSIITLVLLARFAFHIILLLLKGSRARKVNYKGNTLTLIAEKVNPFTFFNTIFLSLEYYENNKLEDELLLHELAHKKQLHSIDVVLMELVLVFFWFNPFVYLFKKLIKANHEYLADDHVLQSGISFYEYSTKIINHTFKKKTAGIVSGFNHVFIRNRLIMLTKFSQKKRPAYQLLLFVPLLMFLFLTIAFKAANAAEDLLPKTMGVFYADEIQWSGDKEIWLKGNLKVKFGRNDFTGEGAFSGFDKWALLVINGKKMLPNSSVNITGKECKIKILTIEQAKAKYGPEASAGAVEVYTSE